MQEEGEPTWWTARHTFQQSPVGADGQARLADEVVAGGEVRVVGPLQGGIETAVHAVELVDSDGTVREAVLKVRESFEFDGGREWAALHTVLAASVPTPEPIAFDPDGRWFGLPALLMTRLAGTPRLRLSVDGEMVQLAAALAAIHDCDAAGLDVPKPRWQYDPPDGASTYEHAVWEEIMALAADAGPPGAFVHRDFHPGNTLWMGSRLTGVIDWEGAARGWPAEDLAKCRWYLQLVADRGVADRLLAAYESQIGSRVENVDLCDASYAFGILLHADRRAFFMRHGGVAVTTESVRAVTRDFIERALPRVASA